MSSALDASFDPKQYVRMFWRRKGVIVLCAVTVICAALIALEFMPQEYESRATLMIEERQRLASDLEKVMGGMRQPSGGWRIDEKRMDELSGRVRSGPFLARVVHLLHMQDDPAVQARAEKARQRHPEVALDEMATRIVVGQLKSKISFANPGSGIYRIIVTDSDPGHAQLLAKWISELYVDAANQSSLEKLKKAHEFGAEQLKIYQQQLQKSELALEQYKQSEIEQNLSRGIIDAGNVAPAETLYDRLMDEVELARVRMLPYSRVISEGGLAGKEDVILSDPQVRTQARSLEAALEEELTNRLVSQTPQAGSWPPEGTYVVLRRGLFQLIERRIATMYPQAAPSAQDALVRFVFLSLDHEALGGASDFLGQAISDFKLQAQSGPRGEIELARLEAEVAKNRGLLNSFQSQLTASDVSQAMELTNLGLRIEILEPPQVPLTPVKPDRMKILLAALVLGPLLGAGFAFAAEVIDSTLRSLSDFERVFTGPVLGTMPLLSHIATPVTGKIRRHWVPAALVGVVLLTALFFLTRATVFHDVMTVGESIQVIDPGRSVTP